MPLEPEARAMLRQTVYVAPIVGYEAARGEGGDNAALFDVPVAVKARVEPTTDMDDQLASGEELKSEYRVITEYRIGQKDHVWLPGDDAADDNAARTPNRIATYHDERGVYLYTTALI